MKAIETIFDGYRFRSRLEARWAVFFKTLGIEYQYEVEGFDLDGVRYLPDFWLPKQQRWIEIKGQVPTSQELAKIEALEAATGYPACIFYGLPGDNDGYAYFTCAHESNGGKSFSSAVQWRRCPICKIVDVNIRHDDECHLYSEVDGVHLAPSSCECTVENFKDYHRKRILAGTSQQLCSEVLDDDAFRERTERFVTELAKDIYPQGLALKGVDHAFQGHFNGLHNAYTAARQARFEFGR